MDEPKELTVKEEDSLEVKLMNETNVDEIKNIMNMFNLNIKKKDVLRTSKLNDLQDKITEEISQRIEKNSGQFSNKDLLDYFKIMQDTINKADISLNNVEAPAIQLNEFNINVDENKLDRQSRQHVLDAVQAILSKAENAEVIDAEFEEEILNDESETVQEEE